MEKFKRIVQKTSERLYEDERLRSNLTDREAEWVLDWASKVIETRINAATDELTASQIAQNESERVREFLTMLNGFAKQSNSPSLVDSVLALQPKLAQGRDFSREETFYLLAALANAVWQIRTVEE